MRTTTYCYPWDLARLGVEATLDRIAGEGFDAIDLASTYHPIDALSPRGGLNLFSDARGAVHFPARAERYGRIKPQVHSAEIAAAWPRAAEHAARIGLALNSWTITLYQPWIRDLYPDCARVLPSGQATGSGVCAANDDVREYLPALCADLFEQCGVEIFRLEAILPYSADFDWLRPRVMVAIPPFARTLSNMCFCSVCTAHGEAAGLDVTRIRQNIVGATSSAIAAGSDDADRAAELAADAELTAFAENHARASIELVRLIDERLRGKSCLATNVGTPYRALLGEERDDAIIGDFIEAVGQIDLSPADPGENRRVAALNAARTAPRELSTLCIVSRGPVPTVASAAQRVSARGGAVKDVQEEAGLGVREFTLYNYGLITDEEVRIFRDAIGRLQPA